MSFIDIAARIVWVGVIVLLIQGGILLWLIIVDEFRERFRR